MKLSEAIRLGAMLRPQGFGCLSAYEKATATCAIGAALDALGQRNTTGCGSAFYRAGELWPMVYAIVAHPVTGSPCDVSYAIWTLNDSHRWTRERIADWVESVEQAHESKPAIVEAVTA